MRIFLLYILSVFVVLPALSQEDGRISDEIDESILLGLDISLFHLYRPASDPYSEATRYYRPQTSQRRRGLDWWLSDGVVEPLQRVDGELEQRAEVSRVRLFGSSEGYNIGVAGEFSRSRYQGWSRYMDLDLRTGRDLNIEGVFRQDLRAKMGASREFSTGHHLSIDFELPILMRGVQSDASQEAITLTGDKLYNPSWGYYDGEVRNSRVSKYLIPEVVASYQRPIGRDTKLIAAAQAEYGRRSISRLGWYDAYNPSPDYYRKLPSYLEQGDTRSQVEELWRSGDSDYTQIAWDKLVAQNQLSSDGSAHYIVEDQVVRRAEVGLTTLFSSDVGDGVELIYGVQGSFESDRCFKRVVDLLGAEYLMDHDQYIGDNVHLDTQMQNDLRNPDRCVVEGDRFGYDYTLRTLDIGGVVGVEYRNNHLNLAMRGEFGERKIERVGHYEKERFAGSLSYGKSKRVSMPSNRVDLRVGYSPTGRHHITFEGLYHQIPVDERDLFIQVQCANRVVDNPASRSLSSVSLGYRYERGDFSIDLEGYLLYSRRQTDVWSYYDDLTYTYSNIVVSDLGTRSVGLDVVANWQISRKLKWVVAMALGDYSYDVTPTVTLYDDQDMTTLSTSSATAVEGCKVGNAPQVLVTSSLDYFVKYGLVLSFDCSYSGGRYVAPSFARRTDRVIYSADSPEMVSEITTQERLSGVFDVTIAVNKSYRLRSGDRLSFNLRVNNLLGEDDRVDYGRESNRLLTTSGGSDIGSRYVEQSSYVYNTPRTYYISCSYNF